ncbi:MAG: glycosyltransferase [Bacteroidota bacterium]|nr:glycosyltransferase [Bacteroidota bacterium]
MKKIISFLAGDAGNIHFIKSIVNYLSAFYEVRIYAKLNYEQDELQKILNESDLVWYEWGNGPVVKGSWLSGNAKTICRIHRYEILGEEIKQINWKNIDNIIFVNKEYLELFKELVNSYIEEDSFFSIIPNPISEVKPFIEKSAGYNIAYISRFNSDKNPALMIQILKKLVDVDSNYKIYMAGAIQDYQLYLYCKHLLSELKIKDNFIFEGKISDINHWLKDKNYILSTSIVEAHPVSISEAMMLGIKPVIHNSYGKLDNIFDKKFLFNTAEEAVKIITEKDYDSLSYKNIISERFSEENVLPKIQDLIKDTLNKDIISRKINKPKDSPFITIGIVTYNRAKYLIQAVQSALLQQGNFEIVIVDDASEDETRQVVEAFNSDKIVYIRNEMNLGRPKSRNKCIQYAKGEYILWMGDDDLLINGVICEYSSIIMNNPKIDVIYGNLQAFDDKTGEDLELYSAVDYTPSNRKILMNLIMGSGITDGGSMIRKEIYEKYGIYDEEYLRAQDNELWARIALKARYFKYNRTVYRYRKHAGNVSFGNFVDTSYESKTIRKIVNSYPLDVIFNESEIRSKLDITKALNTVVKGLVKFQDYYNATMILFKSNIIDDYDSLKDYILYLLCMGQINKAKTEFERLLEVLTIDSTDKKYISMLILEYENYANSIQNGIEEQNLLQVKDSIDSCLKKYGLNFYVAKALADIMTLGGDTAQAYEYFKIAVRLNPTDDLIYQRAQEVAQKVNKLEELNSMRNRIMEDLPLFDESNKICQNVMVSVIIPTYNRKDKLVRAIKSVLAQSYDDYEIIVVNDNGEDVSSVIEELKDPRIRLISHNINKGLSAARNSAIKYSRGKYLAYLDDDDIYYPDHLETLVNYLENSNSKIAYTDANRLIIENNVENNQTAKRDIPYSSDFDSEDILYNNFIPVLCIMHKKECLSDGVIFDESLRVFEDWDMWIKLSRKYEFSHIKKITCEFTWTNDGSTMTSSKWDEYCWTTLVFYHKNRKYSNNINKFQKKILDFINYHENSLMEIIKKKSTTADTSNQQMELQYVLTELAYYYYKKDDVDAALLLIYRILSGKDLEILVVQLFNEICKKINYQDIELLKLTDFCNNEEDPKYPRYDSSKLSQIVINVIEFRLKERISSLAIAGKNKNYVYPEILETKKIYDIVIPIYNAGDKLEICLKSVLANTNKKHNIFLLDDASNDPKVEELLKQYKTGNGNIKVLRNSVNLGFIKNINKGFKLSDNDIVILNSDTQVTSRWLEKMERCLLSRPSIGIVSPLSNNATILSIPEINQNNKELEDVGIEKISELLFNCSKREYLQIPTAVGFCMMISRKTINMIGSFDEAYGLGYCEENDYCMRAWDRGIESVCCDDAYVHHYGEASFKNVDRLDEKKKKNIELLKKRYPDYDKTVFAFCITNPLRYIQEKIRSELHKLKGQDKSKILHVIHNFGALGGTELHTKNIAEGLKKKFDFTIIYPHADRSLWSDMKEECTSDNIRIIKYNNVLKENHSRGGRFIIFPEDLENIYVERYFSKIISGGDYDIIHFQHLGEWSSLLLPMVAKACKKKVILSIHDYFFWCPEYNLVNEKLQKCGKEKADFSDKDCIKCLSEKRIADDRRLSLDMESYLLMREIITKNVIATADKIIVPSKFVKDKLLSTFGTDVEQKVIVVEHGIVVPELNLDLLNQKTNEGESLRIGFLGNLYDRKGAEVFLKTIEHVNKKNIEFSIFGFVPPQYSDRLNNLDVKVFGQYNRNDLPSLLANIDMIIVPSIWDETYCMTVNEALALGVPVLASSVGAINERIINNENGFLVAPNDSHALVDQILEIFNNREKLSLVRNNLKKIKIKTLKENIDDYENIYDTIVRSAEIKDKSSSEEEPVTSIIILTFNGLEYNKECIESIQKHTKSKYELIIVDNNSNDGTVNYLKDLEKSNRNISLILNNENLGFPIAVNQGIIRSKGEYILILNNDTIVTEGWLDRIIDVAKKDDSIGLVGPISNFVSGVQLDKEASYKNVIEMNEYARKVKEINQGQILQFPRIAFLCTLIKRQVIEKIGGLDERFSPGNFEDDDFCLRAQLAGFYTVIAKDVFIHHYGSKSFKIGGEEKYSDILTINKKKFVDKWGADPNEIWLGGKSIKNRSYYIAINSDEFTQSFERGLTFLQDNENKNAFSELLKAKKSFKYSKREKLKNIKYDDVLNLLGNICLIENDLEKARIFFEEQLQISGDSSDACLGLGEIFLREEQFDSAKTMFEWAVKNDPQNRKAIEKLNEVNLIFGIDKEDNSLTSAKVPETKNSFIEMIEKSEALIIEHKTKDAELILHNILTKDPENISALNNLTTIELLNENYLEALGYINRVIEIQSDNQIALDNLNYIQEKYKN